MFFVIQFPCQTDIPNIRIDIIMFLHSHLKKFLLTFSLMLICSIPVFADIVWPSLYITSGMLSIKVILAGFLAELLFVKFFTELNWLKAFLTNFLMNFVSCILGVILIPISGILIELITPFGATFHWSHWLLSYLFVVLINTSIEGLIIKLTLQKSFKSTFWWICFANIISIMMCMLFNGASMDSIKL